MKYYSLTGIIPKTTRFINPCASKICVKWMIKTSVKLIEESLKLILVSSTVLPHKYFKLRKFNRYIKIFLDIYRIYARYFVEKKKKTSRKETVVLNISWPGFGSRINHLGNARMLDDLVGWSNPSRETRRKIVRPRDKLSISRVKLRRCLWRRYPDFCLRHVRLLANLLWRAFKANALRHDQPLSYSRSIRSALSASKAMLSKWLHI